MLVAFIAMDRKRKVDLWQWKREQAHDFESVSNDADSHELLAVIAAVHHEGVGETLDYGAVGLAEALDGITAGGVRDVDGGADLDVVTVGEGHQPDSCMPVFPSCGRKRGASKPTAELPLYSAVASFRRQVEYSRQ